MRTRRRQAKTTATTQPNFEAISYALQNPESEAERLAAWGELLLFLESDPGHEDALNLFAKYNVLHKDFTSEVRS